MAINPVVATATFIQTVQSGNTIGSATGFFYDYEDGLFLVTNQHVARDEKKGSIPDLLRLRLHRGPNDLSDNGEYDVPLYEGGKPLWKDPPGHPDADVALLRLDRAEIAKNFFVKAWSKSGFLPPKYRLDPGEDVFVMGYPLGFHDEHHNLPVFRNAFIASVFRVPFRGWPFFLTDANLHPGTSGSPVITKPKNAWVDDEGKTIFVAGTPYYLVGVHSGTVHPEVTGGVPLGLGVAWYADLIEETAASF